MISVRETNGIGCVNLPKILKEGCEITSSGTTGPPKTIFRTPENLEACNKTAIETQKLTSKSRVLTVTRMTHAGGLLTQTLPAFTLGCEIEIIPFNAFSFLKSFKDYTHTLLPPKMVEAIIKTKGFKDCDLSYKIITLGSDPIPWEHISELIEKGATVICNWGMSEIGPCAINKTYDKHNVWEAFYESPDLTILGNTFYCDWKIEDDILYVKGDISIYDDWYKTKDIVYQAGTKNYTLYYKGRSVT